MKKHYLLLILLFAGLFSQAESIVGQKRQFTVPASLDDCKLDGTLLGDPPQQLFPGMKFTIVASVTSKPVPAAAGQAQATGTAGYVIMIGSFDPQKANDSYTVYNFRGSTAVYFFISSDLLDNLSVQIFPKLSPQFGAMTFPFKYRPQNGAFEPTFSLSATGGVKFDPSQSNNLTFLGLLGVGVSSVQIDQNNSTATEAAQPAAVTLSFSVLAQWKTVQLGLSGGIDNLLSPGAIKYNFQGKPWFSLGVGLTIFSVTTSVTTSSTNSDTKQTAASSRSNAPNFRK